MTNPNEQLAPVTAWWHFDKKLDAFTFNHIEDGWSESERPGDPGGKRWTRGTWHRSHAELRPGGLLGARQLVLLQAAPQAVATDLDTTSA